MNDKIDSSKKKDIQDFTNGSRIIVLDEHDFDGSWAESEEGKRKLAELKEWLKDKELSDYSNPGPIINKIYLPEGHLKWEDLEFKKEEQIMEVILNGSKYKLSYFTDGIIEYVDLLTSNEKFLIGRYVCDYEKQFFNDLRLERVE